MPLLLFSGFQRAIPRLPHARGRRPGPVRGRRDTAGGILLHPSWESGAPGATPFEREALRQEKPPSLRPVRPSVPSTATGHAARQMTDGRARAEETLHWKRWGRADVRTPLAPHRATSCANAAELSKDEAIGRRYGCVWSRFNPCAAFSMAF